METQQDLNVAGIVILDGEYPACQSSMSFVAENVCLMFEVCAIWRGFYVLPKFRDNHSAPIGCRETSVRNYQSALR